MMSRDLTDQCGFLDGKRSGVLGVWIWWRKQREVGCALCSGFIAARRRWLGSVIMKYEATLGTNLNSVMD